MPQWNGQYAYPPRLYFVDLCIDDPLKYLGIPRKPLWLADPDSFPQRQFDSSDAARFCCDLLNDKAEAGTHYGVILTTTGTEVYRTCPLLPNEVREEV